MAASSPSTAPAYVAEDHNPIRLRTMYSKVTTRVLRIVFEKGSADKTPGMPLLDYYASKGITKTKFKEGMMKKHLDKIKRDPEGVSFDVTLLSLCLRKGSHGLAPDGDGKWREGDACIESCITSLKNNRNVLAHEDPSMNHSHLIDKTNQLRSLLEKILQFAQHIYSIPIPEVNNMIQEMYFHIDKYLHDDLMPMTFEEYKKLSMFSELLKFVTEKGVEETLGQYDKFLESEVDILNHLVDLRLPLEDIFTPIMLQHENMTSGGEEKIISLENLFEDENKKACNSLIVIYGEAGSGKTTLTKNVIRAWRSKQSFIKFIQSYTHLLKAECRNREIKSFNELLYHLMPEVSKTFKDLDHLKYVVCGQRVLVIVDGVDEINVSSAQLFDEILQCKKSFGFGVIVMTRPEKLQYIKDHAKSKNISIKYIRLLGVPMENRDAFVSKYHNAIAKTHPGVQNVKGLIDYLKRTGYRLSNVWRLPYNLVLITILWAFKLKNIDSINTAGELYREMYNLYEKKLIERLLHSPATAHLPESQIKWIIDSFVCSLAKESITGLKDDQLNLPTDAYKRLEEDCKALGVDIEEMIGAFLKRIPSSDIVYGYSHKGLQEYLSACYIWRILTGGYKLPGVQKILREFNEVLRLNAVPVHLSRNIMRLNEEELTMKRSVSVTQDAASEMPSIPNTRDTTIIRNILEKVHDGPVANLAKYQNTLLLLIGMFYLEKDVIDDDIKKEALLLLRESGIQDRDSWINVLNEVNCDKYVASFISEQIGIMQSPIVITDNNLFAYVSLLRSLKPPTKQLNRLKIIINVRGDISYSGKVLMELITKHQFQVTDILVTDENISSYNSLLRDIKLSLKNQEKVNLELDFERNPSDIINFLKDSRFIVHKFRIGVHFKQLAKPQSGLKDVIAETLEQNLLTDYKGIWLPNFHLPTSIKHLHVHLPDSSSCASLIAQLRRFKHLPRTLDVSLSIKIPGAETLTSLTDCAAFSPSLYISDVTQNDVDRACDIVKRLCPVDGDKYFKNLFLPSCSLTTDGIERLFQEIKGVWAREKVFMRESLRRIDPEENMGFKSALKNFQRERQEKWVNKAVFMPESLCPVDPEEKKRLSRVASLMLGCNHLSWKNEEEIWVTT